MCIFMRYLRAFRLWAKIRLFLALTHTHTYMHIYIHRYINGSRCSFLNKIINQEISHRQNGGIQLSVPSLILSHSPR